jgi:hypothetical protein
LYRLVGIGGLAEHLEAVRGQCLPQKVPGGRVVVGQYHPHVPMVHQVTVMVVRLGWD